MAQNAVNDETIRQTAQRGDPRKDSSVLEDAQSLWREIRGLSHDRFHLVALETQRAGDSLVTMVITGIMVAFLLIGAWLGLLAATVLWLIEHNIVASNAILLAVVFDLLLSLLLFAVIRRKSRYLQFPATLHSLRPRPTERREQVES